MSEPYAFKPGDVVKWRAGSTWQRFDEWGEVVKATAAATLTVRPFSNPDSEMTFRRGKLSHPCSLVPTHELAVYRWTRKMPKTNMLRISRRYGSDRYAADLVFEVETGDTPLSTEMLGKLAADITAVQAWLASRP